MSHCFAEFARQQVQPTLYSYNVLRVATKDFHHDNELGKGGFGVVYKGILADGTELAVKQLTKFQQGVDDFLNEVIVITDVRHRNLVKLKGCCVHGTQHFLVFEYVENKNLAEALWGQRTLSLDWPKRLNICVGIARGLAYLHEDSQPRIIHRDIKAANVLLDKNMNAKIADFGLARLFPNDQSHISTQIAGTMGYMSPEYATLGQLTPKADVYSFGILLLEIVSGRKNIDTTLESEKVYLVKWAWSLYETSMLTNLIAQDLDITISKNEMKQVIFVALLCVQIDLTKRPMMSHVLAMLQGEMEVDIHFMEPGLRETNHKSQSILHDEAILPLQFARQQVQPTLYSYNVLRVATKDFHPRNKLGQGSFGVVYKGILSDGITVAVKYLTKSQQGVDEFLNEVIVITGVRHRNLVKLKGCCVHGTQRFLVFEYMENSNLAEALWDQQGQQTLFLDWPKRLNICVGVARGLAYLHEDSRPRIIHRDIKATNILLDKNMNAKIADFGLARLFPDDQSHISTQIAGTMGYMSPEYATLGPLTPKADVYSFGILLLEIVSGRKNINTTLESEKVYLVKWAWSLYETNMLINLVDQDLDITISENEMKQVIFVALLCVQIDLTRRPMMSHVMAMLQDDETILPLRKCMSTNDGNGLFSNHIPNSNVEIEFSDLHPR
ncbi:unnamed protein product [Sphagnum jensenii]